MTKSVLTRVASLFLVFVMLLALIPGSVFGVTGTNQDTGPGISSGSNTVSGFASNGADLWGLRFSLYFAEGITDESQIEDSDRFVQLGKTRNIIMKMMEDREADYFSDYGIFKRMTVDGNMNIHRMYSSNSIGFDKHFTSKSSLSVMSAFPTDLLDSGRTSDSRHLNKFFAGQYTKKDLTTFEVDELDFSNTVAIANFLTEGIDIQPITDEMWKTGYYVDFNLQKHYGVFKLYYEPWTDFKVDSKRYYMTLHDAIAFNVAFPNIETSTGLTFFNYFRSIVEKLANAVFLPNDEPSIDMVGASSGISAGSSTKSMFTRDGKLGQSYGVGVVTGGIYTPRPEIPEILKTYVMVESVDADGTVHYKKAAPSTRETAKFNIDTEGNMTQIPVLETITGADGGVALLNDIVSIDKDFVLSDKSEWVDTKLPTDIGVELKESSDDIAGYLTGIVTGSELFIDTYTEAVMVDEDFMAAYKAVSETYRVLQEQNAGVANESTTFVQPATGARSGASTLLIKVVDAVPYVYFRDVKLGMIVDGVVQKVIDETSENTGGVGVVTPANNLILRYILKPNPSQINVIEIVDEETGTSTYLNGGKQDLMISGDVVTVQKPKIENMDKIGEPEQVEWVTNSEYPVKDVSNGTLPPVSDGGLSGTTETTISSYPKEPLVHNLYVKWRVIKVKEPGKPGPDPVEREYHVPEWRLSRYWKAYEGVPTTVATMSLPVTYGCCSEYLRVSGGWNYITRNSNGQLTLPGHLPENLKLHNWIHSETIHSGAKPYVGIYSPSTIVPISGNLTAIKSSDTSGLKVANWLNKDSIPTLTKYDVLSSATGAKFDKKNYNLNTNLMLGAYNLDSYVNGWTVEIPNPFGHSHYWTSKTLGPSSASYGIFPMGVTVGFDRYVQQNTDAKKLQVTPEVTSVNNKTTLKYQLKDTYKIYPEYGMLFANDNGEESIKWVVGDQARLVNPVVYQTLEHKVYVTANSNGTSVATDSRAIANAKKIGESNKQVIYKGAGVNTSFTINKEENSKNAGLLTAKTFTLDFEDVVKSAWGNGDYKSLNQHSALKDAIKTTAQAKASEKLLIDSPGYGSLDYTGAIKNQNSKNYEPVTYTANTSAGGEIVGDGTVVCFTHELIVRGGSLVGVKVFNKGGRGNTVMSITELKTKEPALYEAILNMNLYNETNDRAKTIFSTFEHQTGNILSEGKYGTDLSDIRKELDKVDSTISAITEGKGWYSEDTTVLVIKEYVTNYIVPSISFSDKISMSVKGLDSPINKNLFFSVLGKGYTYLKYDFPIELKDKDAMKNPDVTSAFFEFSSFAGLPHGNGKQVTNYLVPNAAAPDTTSTH